MFEIESDRQIPERKPKYPFDQLVVGQSFRVPVELDEDPRTVQIRVLTASRQYFKRRGQALKLTSRVESFAVSFWAVAA